jgi:endoglucanase
MPEVLDRPVQRPPHVRPQGASRRHFPRWLRAILLLFVPMLVDGCTFGGKDRERAVEEKSSQEFVTAAGRGLVVDGAPTRLKAVNFSNFYQRNLKGTELLASPHHSEADFGRLKELGFNSVRFAFDGDWYVDDPEEFLEWMDRNVEWARQHQMRLILDLHTPIGGFWLDPTSDAVSFDVWTDPRLQQQNADLWRVIAARYSAEPVIAAYDLLNEPVTVDSTGQQWRDLAQKMVDAVRTVDRNHLLVVGGIYGVNGRYGISGIEPHFLVNDPNVVYDFHFYEPIKYTHQYASWVEGPIRDGGRYPDPAVILPTGQRTLLPQSTVATPSLAAGTSGWALYDSGLVPVTDPSAVAAMPVVTAKGGMRGTAYFDTVTVTEYGPDGTEIRQVVQDGLGPDDVLNWHEWTSGGEGNQPAQFLREPAGNGDDASLSLSNADGAGAIAGWSNDEHLFKVVPGNQYRIRGHMRGQDLAPASGETNIGFHLDVYAQTPGAAGGGFLERGKEYLANEMANRTKFGEQHNVPMSVLEFGLVRQAFEMDGKGGVQWVTDMLDLLEAKDLSFAYWEYHGSEMGLHLSSSGAPSEPNQALHDLLAREVP